MNQETLMKTILRPVISEKTTQLADKHGQYGFVVAKSANKLQVKKAIELMFDVKVDSVRTVITKGKRKGTAATPGRRSDIKKAYVKLMPGFDIDLLGAA